MSHWCLRRSLAGGRSARSLRTDTLRPLFCSWRSSELLVAHESSSSSSLDDEDEDDDDDEDEDEDEDDDDDDDELSLLLELRTFQSQYLSS